MSLAVCVACCHCSLSRDRRLPAMYLYSVSGKLIESICAIVRSPQVVFSCHVSRFKFFNNFFSLFAAPSLGNVRLSGVCCSFKVKGRLKSLRNMAAVDGIGRTKYNCADSFSQDSRRATRYVFEYSRTAVKLDFIRI